ncbi:HEAT repeat domain-containing protein [Actinomycetes bacterium KLBMP 9797]
MGGGWLIHQGQTSAAAPAVPFLLRAAADPSTPHRAALLLLVAEAGRREHFGDGTRAGLLRVADLEERYDHAGHSMNRSVRAVRDAITADAPILVALLDDADPRVRCAACYALAATSADHAPLVAALRARFDVESVEGPNSVDPDVVSEADDEVAAVRASLVLAIAQLGLAHRDERVVGWSRAWWSDPGQPPEVRVSAALAWLCLVPGCAW